MILKLSLNYKDDTGDAGKKGLKERIKETKQIAKEKARAEELDAQAQKVIDDAEIEAAKIKKDARDAADKLLQMEIKKQMI